ncbi:MAG: hypothetical protein H6604_08775 [Flavobacteriales bacterium]|nr:hypothetical protein [Flavobacteriales bacterium]
MTNKLSLDAFEKASEGELNSVCGGSGTSCGMPTLNGYLQSYYGYYWEPYSSDSIWAQGAASGGGGDGNSTNPSSESGSVGQCFVREWNNFGSDPVSIIAQATNPIGVGVAILTSCTLNKDLRTNP